VGTFIRDFPPRARAVSAVGFSEGAVWERRRQWPAFAAMLEGLLEEAELALEPRIASMGSNALPAEEGMIIRDCPHATPMPFDADFAMRFLRWREEKRRGRGRWAPRAKPPSIEEVTESIVRKVNAIKRLRQREEKGVEGSRDRGESHR